MDQQVKMQAGAHGRGCFPAPRCRYLSRSCEEMALDEQTNQAMSDAETQNAEGCVMLLKGIQKRCSGWA